MSDDLTDEDRALLDHLEQQFEEIEETEDPNQQVAELQELVVEMHTEVYRLQDELDRVKRDAFREINRIKDRLKDQDAPNDGHLTKIERYAKRIPEENREDVLGPSEYRAVTIFEHWWDLARETDAGWVVSTHRNSTRKNNPSELRIQLQNILDEDLAWEQIYRAMKTVAEMTGGEYTIDEYGRAHVYGGAFEYHERTTPDATDDQTYKVLQLEEANSLTLL